MLDDDAEYEARRQIRAQADADVAEWVASLGQGEDTGIPPPVRISVTEVSSDPVQLQPFAFGGETAGTQPAAGSSPPPTPSEDCFSSDTISVEFSGIDAVGCSCISASDTCSFQITDDTALSDTFSLPKVSSGTGFVSYSAVFPDRLTIDEYSDSGDCSTTPGSNSRGILIIVECHKDDPDVDDGVYVYMEIADPNCFGDWVLFFSTSPVGTLTSDNTTECDTPIGGGVFTGTGIATSGSATITP